MDQVGFVFYAFLLLIASKCTQSAIRDTLGRVPESDKKLLYPVILVPGDGGSQYEAKLNKPSTVHIWCTKQTSDWFALWLNLELLAPYVLDCFVDNMKLNYDPLTRTTHNQPGVQLRQPGFGNTSTVEWLDSSQLGPTSYFYHISERLVKKLGYIRNKNIRGAPYDFRKAPNENGKFLMDLKKLVEETYAMNNNTPVAMLGHSMGNPYIYYFLRNQTQAWKDQHIRFFLSLSSPWGGAVKVMRLMASGDNLGLFVVNPLTVRSEQRTMPSSAWLMPYDTFWNSSEVLVTGPKGNYTVNDYRRFFKDINFPVGAMMREDTEGLIKDLAPPGVDIHCMHGSGVDTPASLLYSQSQWYDNQPDVHYGPGDGTVNMRSLLGCLKWKGHQGQHQVIHKQFEGSQSEHMKILDNEDVKAYLVSILQR